MKGHNELVLNEATMIEAIDYWLTNKVLNPHGPRPRVAGVEYVNGGTFKVALEVPEEKEP